MINIEDKQPSILVVDDEPMMLESIEAILEVYDYPCTLASSGAEAISLLEQQNYDIFLLDLSMPEMSGHQVMEHVSVHYPELDVIIVSGDATFSNAKESLLLGAKDFITKPYNVDDLIKSIRHTYETRTLNNKIKQMNQHIVDSEQRYKFFINNAPNLIYTLDKKRKFTFVNDAVISLLGYTPEELIDKPFTSIVLEEDWPKLNYYLMQIEKHPDVKQKIEILLLSKLAKKKIKKMTPLSFLLETVSMNKLMIDKGSNQIFSGIYGVARDLTQEKNYERQISFQRHYDELTGLPNRALFQEKLESTFIQAQKNKDKFAVISLDMDRFKMINDSLGHTVGDELLKLMAQRLNQCLCEESTLARIAGDDFLCLIPGMKLKSDANNLVKKINKCLSFPCHLQSQDIFVSFSMGIALYPEHGRDPEILVKHAEMAMYHSKSEQSGGYQFFSEQLINNLLPNLSIESGIRKALEDDQFEVYFQPQFNIQKQKFSGVEVLVRWNHPEKGLIMPDSFIPVAEETGLICELGSWVLERSMQVMQQWNNTTELQLITLAVNVSAIQFAKEGFCDFVIHCLKKYNIPGSQLELEITENVMLDDLQQIVSKMKLLGEHGIRFAIDDFGMGYSSLSYLQELPLNNLKIDRSFLSSIKSSEDQNSIVSAIVSMAKSMDMEIVAEGVENEVQLSYVKAIGCPIVQGFYFARPMKVDDAKALILSKNKYYEIS